MTLRSCLKQYANLKPLDPKTISHYELAICRFAEYVGHEPRIADLTDDAMRGFMAWTVSRRSATTANDRRKCLLALWTFCAKRGLLLKWPTVPKMPEPKRIPRAWTRDQLLALIKSCQEAKGRIGKVLAKDWWLAFHLTAWDTAERTRALLSLRWDWLDMDRGILYAPAEARKGKRKDALYQLMPDTVEALRAIRANKSQIIFAGLGHHSAFYKRYEVILRRAGLPSDRSCKPQKMRRSHASHLKAAGGDPTASLMHESDSTTRVSYLDPSICDTPPAAKLFRILPPIPSENNDAA